MLVCMCVCVCVCLFGLCFVRFCVYVFVRACVRFLCAEPMACRAAPGTPWHPYAKVALDAMDKVVAGSTPTTTTTPTSLRKSKSVRLLLSEGRRIMKRVPISEGRRIMKRVPVALMPVAPMPEHMPVAMPAHEARHHTRSARRVPRLAKVALDAMDKVVAEAGPNKSGDGAHSRSPRRDFTMIPPPRVKAPERLKSSAHLEGSAGGTEPYQVPSDSESESQGVGLVDWCAIVSPVMKLVAGPRVIVSPVTNLDWHGFTMLDSQEITEVWVQLGTEVRCRHYSVGWFVEIAGLPCPPMKSKPPPRQVRAGKATTNKLMFIEPVANLDWDGFTRLDTKGIPEVSVKAGTEVRCRDKAALWFVKRAGFIDCAHIVDGDDRVPPMLRRSAVGIQRCEETAGHGDAASGSQALEVGATTCSGRCCSCGGAIRCG